VTFLPQQVARRPAAQSYELSPLLFNESGGSFILSQRTISSPPPFCSATADRLLALGYLRNEVVFWRQARNIHVAKSRRHLLGKATE
jgi:hypothetical protein